MNTPRVVFGTLFGHHYSDKLSGAFFVWLLMVAMPSQADHLLSTGLGLGLSSSSAMSHKTDANLLANELSLQEAMDLALQNQPLLQSLDDAAAAAHAAAKAEGQLPDPKLKLGVINLPLNHGDTLNFNRDDMTMLNFGIMQDMIPRQKLEAASQKSNAEAEQYHYEQLVTARSIQRDVALAWLAVVEAQRKTEIYQAIANDMATERQIATAKISSGGAMVGDSLRLDAELAMTNDKRIMANRDERKARVMLSRWIGVAAQRPVRPSLYTFTQTISIGAEKNEATLNQHPLLQNARQAEIVAQSDVDRAKAERLQNWSWEVMFGKRRSNLSDMVSFQVAIDLPWDRANRQDKRTSEKLLQVEKAKKLTEDRSLELTAELANARADLEAAEARQAEHQTRLIPLAAARLKVTEASYSAGKQSLTDVWEARRAVLEVELDHVSIIADAERANIQIGYLLNDSHLFKGN
ncbi:MAG: TolC family protein [Methylophilaceae bacterium]|nr:TolC family protein [Methylophilaceae bacterium]